MDIGGGFGRLAGLSVELQVSRLCVVTMIASTLSPSNITSIGMVAPTSFASSLNLMGSFFLALAFVVLNSRAGPAFDFYSMY